MYGSVITTKHSANTEKNCKVRTLTFWFAWQPDHHWLRKKNRYDWRHWKLVGKGWHAHIGGHISLELGAIKDPHSSVGSFRWRMRFVLFLAIRHSMCNTLRKLFPVIHHEIYFIPFIYAFLKERHTIYQHSPKNIFFVILNIIQRSRLLQGVQAAF